MGQSASRRRKATKRHTTAIPPAATSTPEACADAFDRALIEEATLKASQAREARRKHRHRQRGRWPRWTTLLPALAPSSPETNATPCCQTPRPYDQCFVLLTLCLDHSSGLTRAAAAWLGELQDRVALYTLAALSAEDQSPYEHAREIALHSLLLPSDVPHNPELVRHCQVRGDPPPSTPQRKLAMIQRWVVEYNRRAAATGQPTFPESIRNDPREMTTILALTTSVAKVIIGGDLRDRITLRDLQSRDDSLGQTLMHFFEMQAGPMSDDGADVGREFRPDFTPFFVPNQSVDHALASAFTPSLARTAERDGLSWYHSPAKVDYWASQYAQGRVSLGDAHYWQRHHIRPVQQYGIHRHGLHPSSEIGAVDAPAFLDLPSGGVSLDASRHEFASFDIVDASGQVWPLFVSLETQRVNENYKGEILLRAGGDRASEQRWQGWSDHIGTLSLRGDPIVHRLWCTQQVRSHYKPWGLFKAHPNHRPASEPVTILDGWHLEYSPACCATVLRSARFGGPSLVGRCTCPKPLQCAAEQAAHLEFTQLVAVGLNLVFKSSVPALFADNHPLATRVQFAYAALMRIFNPQVDASASVSNDSSDSTSSSASAISSSPTGPWLPNVLLHIIAEYAPIDQLPLVTV